MPRIIVKRSLLCLMVGVGALACSGISAAASASLNGAFITRVQHVLDSPRGDNGRAWISVDRTFTLPGVCVFAGTLNTPEGWMLEFEVEHGAFKSLFAMALAAYASGKSVRIGYDDGFGPGTTCRITNLMVAE